VQDDLREKLVGLTINDNKHEIESSVDKNYEKSRIREEVKNEKTQIPSTTSRIKSARGPLQPSIEATKSYIATANDSNEIKPNTVYELAQSMTTVS
jgi:hypothetical protein